MASTMPRCLSSQAQMTKNPITAGLTGGSLLHKSTIGLKLTSLELERDTLATLTPHCTWLEHNQNQGFLSAPPTAPTLWDQALCSYQDGRPHFFLKSRVP